MTKTRHWFGGTESFTWEKACDCDTPGEGQCKFAGRRELIAVGFGGGSFGHGLGMCEICGGEDGEHKRGCVDGDGPL